MEVANYSPPRGPSLKELIGGTYPENRNGVPNSKLQYHVKEANHYHSRRNADRIKAGEHCLHARKIVWDSGGNWDETYFKTLGFDFGFRSASNYMRAAERNDPKTWPPSDRKPRSDKGQSKKQDSPAADTPPDTGSAPNSPPGAAGTQGNGNERLAVLAWTIPIIQGVINRKEQEAEKGPAARNTWPTPTVNGNHNYKGCSPTSQDGLATVAKNWHTPTVGGTNNRIGDEGGLNDQARAFEERLQQRREYGEKLKAFGVNFHDSLVDKFEEFAAEGLGQWHGKLCDIAPLVTDDLGHVYVQCTYRLDFDKEEATAKP